MWFWIFMFLCNLLIPLFLAGFGRVMLKHPPKEINNFFGYRTAMSRKNRDTWDFAHALCGKIWWKAGWLLLVPSIFIQLPFMHSDEDTVSLVSLLLCIVQCAVLIGSIYPVERALKKTFHPDGTRKQG